MDRIILIIRNNIYLIRIGYLKTYDNIKSLLKKYPTASKDAIGDKKFIILLDIMATFNSLNIEFSKIKWHKCIIKFLLCNLKDLYNKFINE